METIAQDGTRYESRVPWLYMIAMLAAAVFNLTLASLLYATERTVAPYGTAVHVSLIALFALAGLYFLYSAASTLRDSLRTALWLTDTELSVTQPGEARVVPYENVRRVTVQDWGGLSRAPRVTIETDEMRIQLRLWVPDWEDAFNALVQQCGLEIEVRSWRFRSYGHPAQASSARDGVRDGA